MKYFYTDPESYTHVFNTEKERDDAAKLAIQDYLEDGEWNPEVNEFFAGIITHVTVETDVKLRPDDLDEDDIDDEGML